MASLEVNLNPDEAVRPFQEQVWKQRNDDLHAKVAAYLEMHPYVIDLEPPEPFDPFAEDVDPFDSAFDDDFPAQSPAPAPSQPDALP